MIHDPERIFYACIAKGTMVLAEFNSKDAEIGAIAATCLEKTPLFHSTFTHTVRSKTYTFLIEENFVYFMISDEKLDKSGHLRFLKSLRDALGEVLKGDKKLEYLSSHCFQGEFNPVFCKLFGLGLDHTEGIWSPGQRMGQGGILHRGAQFNGEKGWERMKMLFGESNIGRSNGEENDHSGEDIGLCRELSLVMHKNTGLYSSELTDQRNAKKVWKKHVWVVLSFDLIVCTILFGVWLWVCRGFKCIRG